MGMHSWPPWAWISTTKDFRCKHIRHTPDKLIAALILALIWSDSNAHRGSKINSYILPQPLRINSRVEWSHRRLNDINQRISAQPHGIVSVFFVIAQGKNIHFVPQKRKPNHGWSVIVRRANSGQNQSPGAINIRTHHGLDTRKRPQYACRTLYLQMFRNNKPSAKRQNKNVSRISLCAIEALQRFYKLFGEGRGKMVGKSRFALPTQPYFLIVLSRIAKESAHSHGLIVATRDWICVKNHF